MSLLADRQARTDAAATIATATVFSANRNGGPHGDPHHGANAHNSRLSNGSSQQGQQPAGTEWMRAVDQGIASSVAKGDLGLLRKALVLGDLGVNDSLHLQHGHTALHIAASHGAHLNLNLWAILSAPRCLSPLPRPPQSRASIPLMM